MKKLALLAIVMLLTGCSGGGVTTEIYSQTIESTDKRDTVQTEDTAQTADAEPMMNTAKPEPKPAPKKQAVKSATQSAGYTIQVVALSHDRGFSDYAKRLPSDQPLWSNKKMVDGLPWYTLLYGEYPSRDAAKRAIKALPQTIQEYGPFVRDISKIKRSLTPEMIRVN
ncbi:SPOR domain-containing protein [Salinivibrio kushneri]|uniref:SPOR domain-containing protein n=1 Tax=Salinivibrio kushneri TaxID=1908198 RepID=UPI0022B41019|nr:SPOR domain-containing protein [Salinivibrio kushneri]WBA13032.1 SPOR domain-containing protein [Salinivibrio kushneri]